MLISLIESVHLWYSEHIYIYIYILKIICDIHMDGVLHLELMCVCVLIDLHLHMKS